MPIFEGMKIELFQIDAFTHQLFKGNPAAVCPLEEWLPDDILQKIALENNLAETVFFIPTKDQHFHIRWFTPEIEMDLCGHATLATAFVLFEYLDYSQDTLFFESRSGILQVRQNKGLIEMDFPSRPPQPTTLPPTIQASLSLQPLEVWKSRDYLLLYKAEVDIINLKVDASILNQINLDPGGIVVTAKGERADFVSRFFTPQASIFEDPVTGSAHCSLVPFWASRLMKNELHALQLSDRGGELWCRLEKDRVFISGSAVKYLQGIIEV